MIIRLTDVLLVVLIAALASFGGGFWYGKSEGRASEKASQNSATVQQLSDLIANNAALVADANKASRALRTATATRTALDNKTNQELKNALAKTAGNRAGCVFDDDSMRHLEAARTRANAAATGGIVGAVPTDTGTQKQ